MNWLGWDNVTLYYIGDPEAYNSIVNAEKLAALKEATATALATAKEALNSEDAPFYRNELQTAIPEAEALQHLEKAEKWGFAKGYLEAETYGLMAEAAYRTGDYERAWRCFDRCLELRPDEWGTLNNYAYYLSEQGIDLEKAKAMSRRTVEAQPDNANSLDTYGWILHLMGRDTEALPYLEKAVRLDPKSETLRKHLEEVRSEE